MKNNFVKIYLGISLLCLLILPVLMALLTHLLNLSEPVSIIVSMVGSATITSLVFNYVAKHY